MDRNSRVHGGRFAIAAATFAAVALLVAACGSSAKDKTASAADPRWAALAFARCMRENGVPDFPDPDAKGVFRGPAHEGEGDPSFQAAMSACRKLAPGSEHEAAGNPAFVEQMRQFSRCMRANGLPDFPDPDAQGRLRGVGHEQEGNPNYAAAADACRDRLPGGGEHGSGAGS
jgi:hypothetical protein